jgi:hypothetical protein
MDGENIALIITILAVIAYLFYIDSLPKNEPCYGKNDYNACQFYTDGNCSIKLCVIKPRANDFDRNRSQESESPSQSQQE